MYKFFFSHDSSSTTRDLASVIDRLYNLSADCGKMKKAVRFIRNPHPTGVNEENILNMSVARHLSKMDLATKTIYEYKLFDP